MDPLIIVALGGLIFFTLVSNELFKYTKVPNVLLLLLIGIAVGPILKLVSPGDFGKVGAIFSTVTLVLILFESGINLKIGQLIKSIGSAATITVFNFIASAVIATAVAYYFPRLPIPFVSLEPFDLLSAAFFGVIVAGTSSAVVIPIIKQLGMNVKGETTLLLESALSDVLCLVIGLSLLNSMKSRKL